MSSIHSVAPVQVLIDSPSGGTPARMVFSPVAAENRSVALSKTPPPELHDFGKAGLKGDKENGYVVELDPSTLVTSADGKPLTFRDVAGFVAYRPGKDELRRSFSAALTKRRMTQRSGVSAQATGSQLPSVYFDGPTAVAYSSDGEFLAVGGSDGTVTVFYAEQSGEVSELRTVNVLGGVKSLVFDDLNRQLYVASAGGDSSGSVPRKTLAIHPVGAQLGDRRRRGDRYADNGAAPLPG